MRAELPAVFAVGKPATIVSGMVLRQCHRDTGSYHRYKCNQDDKQSPHPEAIPLAAGVCRQQTVSRKQLN
jgi:hypothetical protein